MTEQLNTAEVLEVQRISDLNHRASALISLNDEAFQVHCEIADWEDDYSTPILTLYVIVALASKPKMAFRFYAPTLDKLVEELREFERKLQHPVYFVPQN